MNVATADAGGVAVRAQGLSHRYGERRALCDVDLSIAKGQIFALLGPNGGGKTTLFRILSTLILPVEGSLSVLGLDPARQTTELRRRMGVVFQNPGLDGKLTVAENLHHHGRLYGLNRATIRERSQYWLERFAVADRSGDLVEQLSGGLARRVEVARSLLHGPELLVLDEPSTGLDPGARRALGSSLRELVDSDGVTVVLTTHFMEEADRADRVAILDEGRIIATGEPDHLKAEIGHEVLTVRCDSPADLGPRIAERLALSVQVVEGDLRIEAANAHHLVGLVMESFGDEVVSLSVGRPTLEDVFVRLTGRWFWSRAEEG